jgi:phosphopentomutase
MKKRRAIILVIDALGIGAMPDAADYGDPATCNTLVNTAQACGGLRLPHLGALGLGNLAGIKGVGPESHPGAAYGKMAEASCGKDSTTGHWELAGLVTRVPFQTFPNGFPPQIVNAFLQEINCAGVLGNRTASGTEIISGYDQLHKKTGQPILYTSADSVFQIAVNVDVVPLEKLYAWCEAARRVLDRLARVSRVIARPYREINGALERLGGDRRDYSVKPPQPTLLDGLSRSGAGVVGIGKIEDLFSGAGLTHSIHTSANREGLETLAQVLRGTFDLTQALLPGSKVLSPDRELIFINLVDTDAKYGHRRDARGYGDALEEIDSFIPVYLECLGAEDLLIVTADHGCDPTAPGSDHTREYVPLLVRGAGTPAIALGTLPDYTWVASKVAGWLDVEFTPL